MTRAPTEERSFSVQEDEADRISRELPAQIQRLREELQMARARLTKSAREQAKDADRNDGGAEA